MRNKFISWLAIFLSLFVMNQSAGMVHAHSESLDVSIPVQVKTEGVPAPKGEVLFVLSPLDDAPAPASDQIRIAAGNNGIMPAIAFERPGTYAYHLQVSVVDSKKSSIVGISDFRMEITVYNEKVNTEAGSASKLGAVIVASNWNQSADRQPKSPVTVVLKDKVYPTKEQNAHTVAKELSSRWWLGLIFGMGMLVMLFAFAFKEDKKDRI